MSYQKKQNQFHVGRQIPLAKDYIQGNEKPPCPHLLYRVIVWKQTRDKKHGRITKRSLKVPSRLMMICRGKKVWEI
jgi:hypothetical protein